MRPAHLAAALAGALTALAAMAGLGAWAACAAADDERHHSGGTR